MNRDFAEMLLALSDARADFLVVGAHALAFHGHPRATGDLDVWIRAEPENAERVWNALVAFGAPLHELSREDLSTPGIVFQMGRPPARIDILTQLSGLSFEEAWPRRRVATVSGLELPFLSREDLVANKRATGRLKDLADLEELERDAD